MATAVAILVLHAHENSRAMGLLLTRWTATPGSATLAVGALLGCALLLRGTDAIGTVIPSSIPAGTVQLAAVAGPEVEASGSAATHSVADADRAAQPVVDLTPGPVGLGITTPALALNSTRPWRPRDLAEVARFEYGIHKHTDVVMWFADWAHNDLDVSQLAAVRARGSTPEITWDPWDYSGGARQPAYSLASIIAGRHDAYISRWAVGIKAYGDPVLIRFAQEMNGDWYPWGVGGHDEGANGNRTGEFVAAWRHIHDIFRAEGAANVSWIWCPLAGHVSRTLYPGDDYVDMMCLSGFNGGTALPWGGWRTFSDIFGSSVAELHKMSDKPIVIGETGSTSAGGDRPQWIRDMFAFVRANREISIINWFDVDKEADWSLDISPSSLAAYTTSVTSPTALRLAKHDAMHR